jgi:Ti-type conjugative transfer relaxase TraA
MAHYSVHVSEVQRGKGQNAVASAAYNSRNKLELKVLDKKTGVTSTVAFDYSSKGGLAYSKIYAPDHAPEWVYDREVLWNKAEAAERRRNSQTARKFMVALPNELNLEQQIALVEEIVEELVGMGMIVDANIHHDKEGNPHVHLMATTRELGENRYGEIGFKLTKNRDWSRRAFINWTRMRIAEITNEHLAQHGFNERVSHLSYKDLGIDLIPGVHEGPARSIKNAELSDLNHQIALENIRKIEENPGIILDKLAVNKPVFTKEEIAKELEKVLSAGIDLSGLESSDIEAFNSENTQRYQMLFEKIMTSPELSLVTDKDLKDRELYTTTKRLELEERFISGIEELHNRYNHSLGLVDSDLDKLSFKEKIVEKVRDTVVAFTTELEERTGVKFKLMEEKPPLSEEQRRAVLNILNGSDISALQGIPGSGKTTAMREIVRQYEKAGFTVIGVTASSSAALVLEKETGIKCQNASLWRKSWLEANEREFELALRADYYKEEKYQGNKQVLTDKHVIIVDEASMMELGNMDYFTSEVLKSGAKIVYIGDNNQLSAVGYCGAFKKIVQVATSENLEESRRQKNLLHQEATKLLSQYKIREALAIYKKEGNIIINADKVESRDRLIKDFVDEFLKKSAHLNKDNLAAIRDSLICTYSNGEAEKLNREVRSLLKEAGVIKGREHKVQIGGKYLELGRGEQIVFTRNFNRLGKSGIYNGEVGTILKISDPDELGHVKIAITVNKANGKREGIIIDTARYTQGNLFDYGYAVTAHKLQGSSVDQLFVLHDSCVGYEAFNVMMTRHRSNVKLYANEKTLIDALYEGLDLDIEKGRTRYELEEKEADLALLGLVKISSKRTNNSFASDYIGIRESEEGKYLKGYIEANKRVVEIIQTISMWQQKEFRQSGVKPEFWEHESWNEFNDERKVRNQYARGITKRYEEFADLITQTGMNYATILKQAENLESNKYQINNINTQLHLESTNYKNLVSGILNDDLVQAQHNYNNLKLEIAENYGKIQDSHQEIEELKEDEQDLRSAIDIEANYRKVLMPAYLSRIYREEPSEVLSKYETMVESCGIEKAANMIEDNPKILGRLKGFGIGRFSLSSLRDDAKANIENLGKRLTAYSRSSAMEQELSLELADKKFSEKIGLLEHEIERLKSLLPSTLDERFIDKVGSFLGCNKDSKMGIPLNLKDLRESEEFEAVYIKNVQAEVENEAIEVTDLHENKGVTEPVIQFKKENQKPEQVQVENTIITNPDKSSNKELSGSNRLETDRGLKHTEHLSIEENKVTEVQEAKVAVKAEELKKPEANLSTTPANNNKPDKKPAAAKEARLDFEEVKRAINPYLIESIFRQYGQLLNPDGKMEKKGNQLFCGSLNINLRDGRWYRFSDGSKGDIFALVKEAAGVDTKEAFEIVAGHAGIGPKASAGIYPFKNPALTSLEKAKTEALQKEETWRVLDKIPENAPAFKPEKDLAHTLKKNNWRLAATYEYRNKDGKLLGYVVRVLDEEGKKQTLPVSYCHNTKVNFNRWWLKGFSDNGYKPIYGAEKLGQSPLQRVLIVEGEKAADAAAKIFPEHTVISWMGGSASASKANWKAVGGREVTVWPDNDAAGKKAAIAIITEINKVNGFRGAASIVDIHALNLPEKWDLADELPAHLTRKDLATAISNAKVPENENRLDKELAGQVRAVFCDKEFGDYINYGVKRGKIDLGHDYLDLKDAIYREMLTTSVVSFMQGNSNTKEALQMKELLEKPVKNIPALAGNILEIYESSRNSRNISNFTASRQTNSNSKEFTELNPAKANLHEELMQDFVWLHQTQQGLESLNKVHQDKVSHDLAAIIKGYSLSYKGSEKAMSDSDRKIIADHAYKLINSKEWQEELKKVELACKEEVVKEKEQAVRELVTKENYKHLEAISIELKELDKLGYKYDKDELVNNIKSMSYQQKTEYGNKLLLEYTKNYLTPILARHNEEKEKATNYNEFMKAIENEQNTFVKLHNDNRFGIQALDEHNNSKIKLSVLASSAAVIHSLGGMTKVLGTIDYAVKHNITDRETVVADLRRNGGNLEYTHDILSRKCESHKTEMSSKTKEHEQNKSNEIKIDRDRGMSL